MATYASDEQIALVSRGLAALVLAGGVAAAAGTSLESGPGTLPGSAAYVFLALVVAVGVFQDTLSAPLVQIALVFAVVAVGVQQFLAGAGEYALAAVAAGLVFLAEQVRRATGSRRRTAQL